MTNLITLTAPVSLDSRIVRHPDVRCVANEGRPSLVVAQTGEAIEISTAAADLWDHLDGRPVSELVEEFSPDDPGAVIELIRRLRANGLAGDLQR